MNKGPPVKELNFHPLPVLPCECSGSSAALPLLSGRGSGLSSRRGRRSSSRGSLLRKDCLASRHTAILREVEVHASIVPRSRQEQQTARNHREHQKVQDAKEDEALGDADDVAAVRHSKGDRVQQPQQIKPPSESHVVSAETQASDGVAANCEGREG